MRGHIPVLGRLVRDDGGWGGGRIISSDLWEVMVMWGRERERNNKDGGSESNIGVSL